MRRGRQAGGLGLNAFEFFQDDARRIAETGAALPHLQALPQYEGEKADENMSLYAILALVPDRAEVELVLLDTKSGFGLGELDIGLPQLPIAPVVGVRTQHIDALRDRGRVVQRGMANDRSAESRGAAYRLPRDCAAGG